MMDITKKRQYHFIKLILLLFSCLYFGKINLVIGKTRVYPNNAYASKKIPVKQTASSTHSKNKTNHHHLLLDALGSGDLSIWSNSFNFAKSGN
ncbi:MAG: hypothetical protein OXD32_02465, partial [Endozoicomonadaceae bacterium]|nr:hypothetical protein [Endozoicomonadaceae bacterium]